MNLIGFSMVKMRRLFRSQDEQAVRRICDHLAVAHPYWSQGQRDEIAEIVRRAVMFGVPFPGLETETYLHVLAASAFATDGQEGLGTFASVHHASASREGLRPYVKYARPEIKAFLRGLAEGVPIFGQSLSLDGPIYAAISLEKLKVFERGLHDLRDQIVCRVEQKKKPSDEAREGAEFVTELCGWVDQIREAGMDLWYYAD